MKQKVIIIGAGPAGLTAALELLRNSDIQPIILEASGEIGGISRTVKYKGNRMDIGGHRFFSKSDRVMQWWADLMPTEKSSSDESRIVLSYQGKQREVVPSTAPKGNAEDLVMLVRPRKSRIYYLRKFFDYPIKLTVGTAKNLGLRRMLRIGYGYIRSRLRPITPEKSLEDFLINRFGKELYLTFFKSYTEKVWGTPCHKISAEWGAQRIKGLSLTTAVKHFFTKLLSVTSEAKNDVAQKGTDTSLIERFLYPKFGPGQLWEHVAEKILLMGGEIHLNSAVDSLSVDAGRVTGVLTTTPTGERRLFKGDSFISTMPIRDLVRSLKMNIPKDIQDIAEGLQYRDFITVGVLVDKLAVTEPDGLPIKDNWIYIQEPDVQLGRLQIFNNWSPYMLNDPTKVWMGLEYFCSEGDPLWRMTDAAMEAFAVGELCKIGILDNAAVLDAHVVRVPKTYPAYFGTYDRFGELRTFLDGVENLYLVGRNGMHKYNNQDHSMLTAMHVAEGIIAGEVDRTALWSINTEQEYQEEKQREDTPAYRANPLERLTVSVARKGANP